MPEDGGREAREEISDRDILLEAGGEEHGGTVLLANMIEGAMLSGEGRAAIGDVGGGEADLRRVVWGWGVRVGW